ncbi:MAG: carboxypeptidase-like regulatory domain-containing protein [Nanoarchaeota archaeon]
MNDKPRASFALLFLIFFCMACVLASSSSLQNPLFTVNQHVMGSPEQQIAISASQLRMSAVAEQEQVISLNAASSPDFNQTTLNTTAELPVQGKKLEEKLRTDISFIPASAQATLAHAPQALTATANVSSKAENPPRLRPPFRAAALLLNMPGLPADIEATVSQKLGKQQRAEDDPVEVINLIINDNMYIWTTYDFYTGSDTVRVQRVVEHGGPAEDVTETVYIFNKWGTYRYYGYYNRHLNAYQTQFLPDLNIPASWILSNLGGNGFFEVYSLLQDINSNSIGEYSNQFGINALYAEGKLRSQETSTPISGATVKFIRCSDNAQMDSSTTNSSGGYHLEVPFGTYRLMAEYNGHSYLIYVNGIECYNYAAAGIWTFSDIYLYIYSTLHGPVQNPDGNSLGGGIEWDTCAGQYVIGSSFFGTFQVRANPGSYKLRLNYNNVWYDITVDGQICKSYGPGDLSLSTLTLSTTATGTVKDELGNPQNGATVQFTDCGGAVVKSTTTNSAGYFSLTAQPGNYILKVINNGYTYPITACNNWEWRTYNLGDIPITRLATLNGRIEGENDLALTANVGWYTCADAWNTGGDFTGNFQLRSSPGNYKLKVIYNGITYIIFVNGQSCPHYDPGTYSLPDIQLISDITGLVKNENNQPISGATAQFITCAGSTVKSTTTNANGRFYLTATAGNYKLRVIYSEATYDTACTNFPADSTQRDIGTLTIPVQARLIGSVRDEFGNPNTAYVEWDTCANQFVTGTQATGDFILSTSTGSYKLKATYDGNSYIIPVNGVECYSYSQPGNYTLTSPLVFYIHTWLTGQVLNQQGYPIQGATAEFTDCSNTLLSTGQTGGDGRFSIHTTPGSRKFKIIHNDVTYTFLINGQECPSWSKGMYQILDPITLASDCSVYNNHCYDDHTKLFNCYYDQSLQQCRCYSMQCEYGCTEGLPECNAANQGTINVDVDDMGGNPLIGAKVALDNIFNGYTDIYGKKALTAQFGYRQVRVDCPQGNICSSQNVYVDSVQEYAFFDCSCTSSLYDVTLQFLTQYGILYDETILIDNFALSNVYVFVDNQQTAIGSTNPHGYLKIQQMPQGIHTIRIVLLVKPGLNSTEETYWQGETTINVNSHRTFNFLVQPTPGSFHPENYTAEDQGNYSLNIYQGEYRGRVIPVAIVVGLVILDYAMTTWDAYDAAQCGYDNENNIGGECWDEALWLGVDFIPDGGAIPILKRLGRAANHIVDGFNIFGKIEKESRRVGEFTRLIINVGEDKKVFAYIRNSDAGAKIVRITQGATKVLKKFREEVMHTITPIIAHDPQGYKVIIGEKTIQQGRFPAGAVGDYKMVLGETTYEEYARVIKNNALKEQSVSIDIIQRTGPQEYARTQNYIFEFSGENGKQLKIFELKPDGTRGISVGELDSLTIVNGKPVIGEAKVRKYEDIQSDFLRRDPNGELAIMRTKVNPVKELALQKGWENIDPEIILMAPQDSLEKAMRPGEDLNQIYNSINWLDVEKMPMNWQDYDTMARELAGSTS